MAYSDLTAKQQRFCDEYLIDLNATKVAIRAGYSAKTAKEIGYENLTKPHLQNYLSYRQKELQKRTEITQDTVIQELAKIAFIDIRKFYDQEGNLKPIHALGSDCAAALAGMDIEELYGLIEGSREKIGIAKKIKMHNKVSALESLGKHLGIYEKDNKQKP